MYTPLEVNNRIWVKITLIKNYKTQKEKIFFPKSNHKLTNIRYVSFGKRIIQMKINNYSRNNVQTGFSFEKPLRIKITTSLQKKLLIPDSLVYQVKFSNNKLEIGPVIALLLGNYDLSYNHLQTYNTRLGIYKNIGGLIYAFSPTSINFKDRIISGRYYNYKDNTWQPSKLPFPSFIYRRNFSTISRKTITKLKNITSNNLFNSCRLSKFELYEQLSQYKEFEEYLPHTEAGKDYQQVKNFVTDNQKIILKPVNSSRGRGIYIIEKKT